MKFTINGFSQKELCNLKLDCKDALILRWYIDFLPKMATIINDGKIYQWVKYQAIIDDLPVLMITNKQIIARHFKKMVDCGILERFISKDGGVFTYYRLNPDNYIKLIDSDYVNPLTEKLIPIDRKVDTLLTEKLIPIDRKVETKDTSINTNLLEDSSINNNKEILPKGNIKKVEKIYFNFDGYNDDEIEAIKLWIKYKKTKPIQIKSLEREIAKIRADNDIIAVIDRSIANSWAGLFPLNKQTTKNIAEDPYERVRRIMRNPNAQDWDAPNDVF
jgi:hypothetical protein